MSRCVRKIFSVLLRKEKEWMSSIFRWKFVSLNESVEVSIFKKERKRKKSECRMSSIFCWKFVSFKWKSSWISFKLLLLFMRCSKTFEEACTRLLGICPRKDHGNPACWVTATECVEVSFLQSELTFSTLSFHGSRVSRLWIEVSSVLRLVSDSLYIFIGFSSRVTLKKYCLNLLWLNFGRRRSSSR